MNKNLHLCSDKTRCLTNPKKLKKCVKIPLKKALKPRCIKDENRTNPKRKEENNSITSVVNNSSNTVKKRALLLLLTGLWNGRLTILSGWWLMVCSRTIFAALAGIVCPSLGKANLTRGKMLLVPRVKSAFPTCRTTVPTCRPCSGGTWRHFSAAFSLLIAFSGSCSSSRNVTNLLPMIAPDACSQAAWKVALLEMPNPTINGLFRCISSIFLK